MNPDGWRRLEPGLYPDVPFDDYLRIKAMRQSVLKQGRQSMAHLHDAWLHPIEKASDDMNLGSALHTTFLEPELLPERVALWDRGPRNPKNSEWIAFQDDNPGKIILPEGNYAKLIGMTKALRKHPVVKAWQARMEDVEVTGIREFWGTLWRGRVDALTDSPIVDLKKTRSTDERLFKRQAHSLGYVIQGAIYRRIFDRERFLIIAVEDAPPYDIVEFPIPEHWLDDAEKEVMALIQAYQHCGKTGIYPGRADEPVVLEPDPWMLFEPEEKIELSMGDTKMEL